MIINDYVDVWYCGCDFYVLWQIYVGNGDDFVDVGGFEIFNCVFQVIFCFDKVNVFVW